MEIWMSLYKRVLAAVVVFPALGLLAACSSSRHSADPAILQIVVTNDDGYSAPGIATISSALALLPNVHVTVVAPATNQSGAGGKTTAGVLTVTRGDTANGMPAYAVAGTPADTIRAALDQLHLHPQLVVSGSNLGQNLGPALDLSGTIGAARAAVTDGIPAVAVSSGVGNPVRFSAAIPFVTQWVEQHRADLLEGRAQVQVVSFNVPSCSTGQVRGLVQVPPDLTRANLAKSLGASDCTSTAPPGANDVAAFAVGFATESVVPTHPSSTN
jgi:5'-nucleotidase